MVALKRWGPVVAYAALIFALSAQASFDFGPRDLWKLVFDFDKVVHACEYAVLALLLCRATNRPAVSWLIALLYGVSDEVHQSFVPGRTATVFDAVADATGAGLACAAWYWRARRPTPAMDDRPRPT